jgi:citronellol/citronellal dehydrogenase
MPYQSIFRPDLFRGEVHVVTGGGSGIGRCTAHELAALGATVALVGRKKEKLDEVAKEIAESGGRAHTFACDIRDEAQVQATVKSVIEVCGADCGGRIHALVNNAGGQFAAPLAAINQKGWETVVRTNLTGGFLMARECYVQSMSAGGGAIVNIVADYWGSMTGMGHSGAARAGMVSFTETASVEWAASGVRVNAVAPGWIASSGLDQYPPQITKYLKLLPRAVPAQRLGTESEVSAAIVFLLSPAAAFISGSTLRVDGAAPNARLASPWSAMMRLMSGGPEPDVDAPDPSWPLPAHDKSKPFDGFHLAKTPKALGGED